MDSSSLTAIERLNGVRQGRLLALATTLFARATGPLRNTLAIALILSCTASRLAGEEAGAINPENINPEVAGAATETVEIDDAASLPRVRIDHSKGSVEEVAQRYLAEMTLGEKIGQLCQLAVYGDKLSDKTAEDLRAGRIGSLFYTGSAAQTREAQRIAREESRLGLPLLSPRDVIHGFRTVFPIPVGQAASWNPELIRQAAAVAADEAKAEGINWTFAPMLDVCRDPRWGRIAESVGEDPLLAERIAEAMVTGYQQPVETSDGQTRYEGIAACAKHFAAYGLSEGGRDYNRAQVAISELHNVILRPFKRSIEAGCATVMTGFSSVNGVPATGHHELLTGVLKGDWGFDGLVVSDWGSVVEMIAHGYAADDAEAAELALNAGVDMEMATNTYREHLRDLHESGRVGIATIDEAVLRILRVKLRFAQDIAAQATGGSAPTEASRALARKLAEQSVVMVKNDAAALPINAETVKRVAIIGPLADAARDQLGCWMLDGKPEETVTVVAAVRAALGENTEVEFLPALESSLDESTEGIAAAAAAAGRADYTILCVGESWQLAGEARCRAEIDLPGAQSELVRAIAETDTKLVMVVLAGRPLTIGDEIDLADAVLYAWHPGTMGGPAIADLLTGASCPSGKLPVTFPKRVGQAPLYYNHPRTGRPALAGTRALIGSGLADFPEEQKYRSHYLDVDPFPLLPFGFGLSYTTFEYGEPELTSSQYEPGQTIGVRVRLTNTGHVAAEEVAQLYVQDVSARLVRPVRELKGFRRVMLEPGESVVLEFALSTDDLAYYDNNAALVQEPGEFRVGVGGDSTAPLSASFTLRRSAIARGERSTSPR